MSADLKLENTEYLRLCHQRNLSELDVHGPMEISQGFHRELRSLHVFQRDQFE